MRKAATKKVLATAVILLAVSPLSFAKCKLTAGATPDIPEAATASLEEMLNARHEVSAYLTAASDFVKCANGRGDRRVAGVMKKMRRVAKKYETQNTIFKQRLEENPDLFSQPEVMLAQK